MLSFQSDSRKQDAAEARLHYEKTTGDSSGERISNQCLLGRKQTTRNSN